MRISFASVFVPLVCLLEGYCNSVAFAQDPALAAFAPTAPVSAPIPMPGQTPIPPDRLRSANPAVLPMTGVWRFSLTHGQIVGSGVFQPKQRTAVTASSEEAGNAAEAAFDSNADTRWCASDASFPQWLQADLGAPLVVKKVDLTWERPEERYDFRIEGSSDGRVWSTLAAPTASGTTSDGPVSITSPPPVRYFRVVTTGAADKHWASIRECRITVIGKDGQDAVWAPPTPPTTVSENERDAFAAPDFNDAGWDNLAVPSNWEMAGYSVPTYNSVDDTVGQYRRSVDIPASFAGKRVLWRFDGVLDGAEIWVNGRRAGYHESGYTAFDVDVTDLIKPGTRNAFAVRVSKTTPSVDCETGDFQCMGGIYRENYLIALSQTHIQSLTVRTDLDSAYRNATLQAIVSLTGTPGQTVNVAGTLTTVAGVGVPVSGLNGKSTLGADGRATLSLAAPVIHPQLWSAEKPNLYYLTLSVTGADGKVIERVEQRFGFRQVDIKNGVLLWNGRPIKCAGVCRHDFWADKGFALTDANWRKDLTLMRAANVNAIRTSHYNHAARFLEMCDEMGFYVLDEVPFCWIGKHFSDPAWTPYLIQRANETIARDRNRPCVLAWSVGNENGGGKDGQAVLDRVAELDPTRPAFVSQQWPNSYKGQAFRDSHYPTPADLVGLVTPTGGGAIAPATLSENPHIFYQKEAHDYDPGVSDLWGEALKNVWDLIRPQPTIVGSFIWEWQNQGIADHFPNKTRDFWYGQDRLRQENNKGIVDAYRNPKPEWWYVHEVYSPVGIAAANVQETNGECVVPLENRYAFTDLQELTCRWTVLQGDRVQVQGIRHIACAPGSTTEAHFSTPGALTALRVEFLRADGTSVIAATLPERDLKVSFPSVPVPNHAALSVEDTANELRVHIGGKWSTIVFDKSSGKITDWSAGGKTLLSDGPTLNLGEARPRGEGPTKDYIYGPEPPKITQTTLRWNRVADGIRITVAGDIHGGSANAGRDRMGALYCTYTIQQTGVIDVAWKVYWTADNAHAWETGLSMKLPKALTRMRWSRAALFTDYPTGHSGAPSGACAAGDSVFSGTKRDLRYLTLTDANGAGLALVEDGSPLQGRAARAARAADGITLFASREVAGPRDFSWPYVSEHDIALSKEASIGGAFQLYPVGFPTQTVQKIAARR